MKKNFVVLFLKNMLYFRNFSIFFSASPKSYSACINQPSFSFNFKTNLFNF